MIWTTSSAIVMTAAASLIASTMRETNMASSHMGRREGSPHLASVPRDPASRGHLEGHLAPINLEASRAHTGWCSVRRTSRERLGHERATDSEARRRKRLIYASRGRSSVGRASASQAVGRGFESLRPLRFQAVSGHYPRRTCRSHAANAPVTSSPRDTITSRSEMPRAARCGVPSTRNRTRDAPLHESAGGPRCLCSTSSRIWRSLPQRS
jgi:hypothetical protein